MKLMADTVTECCSFSPPQLSPEEEEKRRIRRERNKMAAAKCRNRRRELTDTLQAVGRTHGSLLFKT